MGAWEHVKGDGIAVGGLLVDVVQVKGSRRAIALHHEHSVALTRCHAFTGDGKMLCAGVIGAIGIHRYRRDCFAGGASELGDTSLEGFQGNERRKHVRHGT